MKKSILGIVMMLGLLSFGKAAVLDEAVTWMNQNDLTIFKTVTDYKPNNYIRRDEAAKLFVKFAKLKNKTDYIKTTEECQFSDLNDAHADLKDIVVESCRLGIFQGANGKFMPKGSLNNEQAVTVLIRILEGKQSETGVASWADNYYNKADELNLLDQINLSERKIPATRGNIGIVLANVKENILKVIVNKAKYEELVKIIESLSTKEPLEASYDNYSYTYRYQLTSSQWETIKNKYLLVYESLGSKYKLSKADIIQLKDSILIDFYYRMLQEKQYDIAISLTENGASTAKKLEDIYKNSGNIYINGNIKKIENDSYQFVVRIEDTAEPYFEEFTVQKSISSNNKIKSISSKLIDKYLCYDMGCENTPIPYDKGIFLQKLGKDIDTAITTNAAKGRLFSIEETKRLMKTNLYQTERLNTFLLRPNVNGRATQAAEYFLDTNFIYSIDVIKDTKGNRKYQFIFYNTSDKAIDIDGYLTLNVNIEGAPTIIHGKSANGRIKTTVSPNTFQVLLFDEDSEAKSSMDDYTKNNTKPIWISGYLDGTTKKLGYSAWISF